MAKSTGMDDIIDFVSAETDQESCSGTDLDIEKESDDSDIDYLSDSEPQIQFVHSQQVQCTTNDNDDDGMSNVNKANVNHDSNAELVLVDSAKNDKFENNDDDQIWGHQSLTVHLKARNKESEVLIVVVTVTMMKKKKQHHNTVMDMLLLTIVLAVDVLRLVVDQSIDGVYIEEVECVLGVMVAEFLRVVQ